MGNFRNPFYGVKEPFRLSPSFPHHLLPPHQVASSSSSFPPPLQLLVAAVASSSPPWPPRRRRCLLVAVMAFSPPPWPLGIGSMSCGMSGWSTGKEGVCEAGTSQTPSEVVSSQSLCQHDRRLPLRLTTFSPVSYSRLSSLINIFLGFSSFEFWGVVCALRLTLGSGGRRRLPSDCGFRGVSPVGGEPTGVLSTYFERRARPSSI